MPDERSAPGTFPVVRSLLSTTALAEVIGAAYGLDEPRCRLIKATSRDVYRVDTRQGPSVLAVYRHDRRSADQIEAELDVLDDLAERGPSVDVAVAPALRTVTGERLLALAAPEGTRCAVLFRYAQGSSLGIAPDAEVARRYGQLVARVHALTDDWLATSTRARLRPALDATLLVDRSLQGIEGLLRDRPSDLAGLQPVAVLLRRRLAGLPREAPGYGLVHGDVIPQNLLVASDGRLTLLDFDFSGPGWRVFDVATYLWDVRSRRGTGGRRPGVPGGVPGGPSAGRLGAGGDSALRRRARPVQARQLGAAPRRVGDQRPARRPIRAAACEDQGRPGSALLSTIGPRSRC